MTIQQIAGVIAQVKYRNWRLNVVPIDERRAYLQITFNAPCTIAGSDETQYCRKWILATNMTPSEVVQTALLAVRTAVEHELREEFSYRGRSIFGPHFDVEQLVALVDAKSHDIRKAAE